MSNMFDWAEQAKNLDGVAKVGGYTPDERYWKMPFDKASGVGVAIVRFLPFFAEAKQQPVMFIGYKGLSGQRIIEGKTRYLIGKSPASVGKPCPIEEAKNKLIKMGGSLADEANKVLGYKNRYVANVMVMNDPQNPENNGKIFLYEFGANIVQKIQEWASPSKVDLQMGAEPKNAFDPLQGFNVKLKLIKEGKNIPNYNSSEISPAPSLAIEGVDTPEKYIAWAKQNLTDLDAMFVRGDAEYNTYEELKDKLNFIYPEINFDDAEISVKQPTPAPKAEWGEPRVTQKAVEVEMEDVSEAFGIVKNTAATSEDSWLN